MEVARQPLAASRTQSRERRFFRAKAIAAREIVEWMCLKDCCGVIGMATASLSLRSVAADVSLLASAEGATAYLAQVLEMTAGVFATAPLTVMLDHDPEIPGDQHIRIEVDVSGRHSVEELLCRQERWTQGLFQICPSTQVWLFRLGIV